MHLVTIGWLFVIFTMALTTSSVLAGVALFVGLELTPLLVYLAIAMRRTRARRARESRRPV